MKPSKTAYPSYTTTTKKKPAKRKDGGNPMVDKLRDLKYRINKAYDAGRNTDKTDKDFVMGLIHNIRKREENPSKIQLEECNKIWKKYER